MKYRLERPGSMLPRRHRASANVPSRRCEPGPSYYKSHSQLKESSVDDIATVEVETAALRQARQRRAGRFLKGPVLMSDIATAAKLQGKTLVVYLGVRHRIDLTRSAAVTLPASLMRELGVDKDSKARALRQLEETGLITVQRSKGKPAIITLNTENAHDR